MNFIDTNVWLYALIQGQDAVKRSKAQGLLTTTSNILISTQVINELCVNLVKKEGFSSVQIRDVIIDYYAHYIVIELNQSILVKATHLREAYTFSYWDSLIVASALAGGATALYSEDMHDGLVVEQLTIINPFT